MKRVILSQTPFPLPRRATEPQYFPGYHWPAAWIRHPGSAAPCLIAYRLKVCARPGQSFRLHLAADERYELWWNGQLVGRGNERCSPMRWAFDSYEGVCLAETNNLVVRVWSLGTPHRPAAQQSCGHGLLVADDPANQRLLFNTGVMKWESRALPLPDFLPKGPCFGTSAFERQPGLCGDTSWQLGEGEGWVSPEVGPNGLSAGRDWVKNNGPRLAPATLPAMLGKQFRQGTVCAVTPIPGKLDESPSPWSTGQNIPSEQEAWQSFWCGRRRLQVPARTRRRVLIDLEDYVCVYAQITMAEGAGSSIQLHWEESLYTRPGRPADGKPHRNKWKGCYFEGFGDSFHPDGPLRHFAPLWWRSGRFLQIQIETAGEPLELIELKLEETHYPYAREDRFESGDKALLAVLPILERGLQMCAHDFLMDCPYYEQLMYAGDAFIQSRVMLATSREWRLPRKVLSDFYGTRTPDGVPTATFTAQGRLIPPFALSWISGLRDYLLYREDPEALRSWLPAARSILDWWLRDWDRQALVPSPQGWNFVDWVNWDEKAADWENLDWHTGAPPGSQAGESSVLLNWWLVKVLKEAAQLETWALEPLLAQRWSGMAEHLVSLIQETGWDRSRRLYADTPRGDSFSQHTQILALLAADSDPTRRKALHGGLREGAGLAEASLFFSDLFLEAAYREGAIKTFYERLEEWRLMPGRGFRTPYEVHWNNTRSDCHAWACHPLYHVHASIIGVRPAAPGFRCVKIAPLLREEDWVSGQTPHPSGNIFSTLERQGHFWRIHLAIPKETKGIFVFPSGHHIPFVSEFEFCGYDPGHPNAG